jgi:hypothetical protein
MVRNMLYTALNVKLAAGTQGRAGRFGKKSVTRWANLEQFIDKRWIIAVIGV